MMLISTYSILIMKTIIFLGLLGLALARPQEGIGAYITKFQNDVSELGNYFFNYETSDGTKVEQQGELKNAGTDEEAVVVRGEYSYVGPDGNTYNVKYIADENGFQPEGEHIPPAADVKRPKLGIPSAAINSLAGGGLG